MSDKPAAFHANQTAEPDLNPGILYASACCHCTCLKHQTIQFLLFEGKAFYNQMYCDFEAEHLKVTEELCSAINVELLLSSTLILDIS